MILVLTGSAGLTMIHGPGQAVCHRYRYSVTEMSTRVVMDGRMGFVVKLYQL